MILRQHKRHMPNPIYTQGMAAEPHATQAKNAPVNQTLNCNAADFVRDQLQKSRSEVEFKLLVHGTSRANYEKIMNEGLKHGPQRVHIHCVSIENCDDQVEIPRLAKSPDILIYVDAAKATRDGVLFYRHPNSDKGETILTKGKDGLLDSRYFRRVVDARTDTVLYQAPDDPEAIKKNTSAQRASDFVVHGTYFENLPSIFRSGLLPGANPSRPARQHKMHHHVHTALPHAPLKLHRRADVRIVVDVAKLKDAGKEVSSFSTFIGSGGIND